MRRTERPGNLQLRRANRGRDGDPAASIVEFCQFLRANGLSAGITETLSALEAVRALADDDAGDLRFALRAVLCSSREEWELFDRLFDVFWNLLAEESRRPKKSRSEELRLAENTRIELMWAGSVAGYEANEGAAITGASAHERLRKADFSHVAQDDLPLLERLAERLLRQMSLRLSRRLRRSGRRVQVDLRRTIRASVARGGEPIPLRHRGRTRRPLRLVILLDISGSMNPYSLFLVRFAYVLQRHFSQVRTFLFSTGLVDATGLLRARQLGDALRALAQQTTGWSGGTRIGDSLRTLRLEHGRLFSRETLFMILSDGWDTGSPEALSRELAAVRRQVRKLVWLNPLLGIDGYQPITRGMSAALPHLDAFLPAHNLESLLQLDQHLGSRGGGNRTCSINF